MFPTWNGVFFLVEIDFISGTVEYQAANLGIASI